MEYFPLVIPALFSLLLKIFFIINNKHSARTSYFTILLYICAIHSACEVVTFLMYVAGNDVDSLFRFYYIAMIWWICFAFAYAVHTVHASKLLIYLPILATVILSVLISSTDLILSGYYSIGYSITAIREEFYSSYQLYIFLMIFASIILLGFNAFKNKSSGIQVKSICLLFAFSAPFFTIVSITILMIMGLKINMLMVLPLSTAFFCWMVVKSQGMADLRRMMPYSDEYKFATQMTKLADQISLDKVSLKEADRIFQKAIIEYKKKQYNGNVNQTAIALGIARSTLYSKFEKLGIREEDKD